MDNLSELKEVAKTLTMVLCEAIKDNLCDEYSLTYNTENSFGKLENNDSISTNTYDWHTIGIKPPGETMEELINRVVQEEVSKVLGKNTKTTETILGVEKYHLKHK